MARGPRSPHPLLQPTSAVTTVGIVGQDDLPILDMQALSPLAGPQPTGVAWSRPPGIRFSCPEPIWQKALNWRLGVSLPTPRGPKARAGDVVNVLAGFNDRLRASISSVGAAAWPVPSGDSGGTGLWGRRRAHLSLDRRRGRGGRCRRREIWPYWGEYRRGSTVRQGSAGSTFCQGRTVRRGRTSPDAGSASSGVPGSRRIRWVSAYCARYRSWSSGGIFFQCVSAPSLGAVR